MPADAARVWLRGEPPPVRGAMISPPSHRVCNGIIETLASSEDVLARDLAGYREALHVAVEQLHEATYQLDRLREQHRRLRGEYRRLHKHVLRDERKAA